MTQAHAGWYPAPDRYGQVRYWDGINWTGYYAAAQPQPAYVAPVQTGIKCPHCGSVGRVKTKQIKTKQGISGGKATGAVLTAGFSVLATGLSRKQEVTECRCRDCKMVWHVT